MPNPENLKNGVATQFQSGEKAAENGRKGGIASGVAKRKKNAARTWLKEILAYKPKITPAMRAGIENLGGDPEAGNYTTEALIMVALAQKGMKGDTRAVELYLEMLGEDPKTVLEEKRMAMEKQALKEIRNSDGFMEAMNGMAEEAFADGGDTPDAVEDE